MSGLRVASDMPEMPDMPARRREAAYIAIKKLSPELHASHS